MGTICSFRLAASRYEYRCLLSAARRGDLAAVYDRRRRARVATREDVECYRRLTNRTVGLHAAAASFCARPAPRGGRKTTPRDGVALWVCDAHWILSHQAHGTEQLCLARDQRQFVTFTSGQPAAYVSLNWFDFGH